jgi:hypothetical protein
METGIERIFLQKRTKETKLSRRQASCRTYLLAVGSKEENLSGVNHYEGKWDLPKNMYIAGRIGFSAIFL